MGLLSAQSVHFAYDVDKGSVLDQINISVERGEFVSIVGPSGSGKTTLLRLLAGHISPTSGRVLFHDEEMEGPDIRLVPGYEEIKLVYQQFELSPNISARENINAALNGYTAEYRSERINFLLDFFGLTPYADHKPYQLSGGQQQRLAIAKAMSTEPEVLLLDEPFSALDPMNSAIFLKEVARLARESDTAVVLVTHDTRDAMMADRVVVLMGGAIQQEAPPQKIYYHPQTVEVGSFFGPVNTLSAAQAQALGYETEGDVYLRPESFDIDPAKEGEGLTIKEVLFRGAYQVLIITQYDGHDLVVYDFHKRYSIGDLVSVAIIEDHVMKL
ncbi:MAG: ABC transporter ATP-binding protein [Cyclobacteriaceae bacterium]